MPQIYSPEDLTRAAALIAELVTQRTDPLAGIFARGGTGIQWSRTVEIPPTPVGGSLTEITPLLSINVSEGFPRVWTVTVREQLQGAGLVANRSLGIGSFCRIRWSNGNLEAVADFDLCAVGACFPLTAQAFSIGVHNANSTAFPPPAGGPVKVACAVSGVAAPSEYRAPRRTVLTEIPAVPVGTVIAIPDHAQQVQFHYSPTTVVPVLFDWNDAKGAKISGGQMPGAGASPVVQDIPGNASAITIATNPNAAATDLASVFRLGF